MNVEWLNDVELIKRERKSEKENKKAVYETLTITVQAAKWHSCENCVVVTHFEFQLKIFQHTTYENEKNGLIKTDFPNQLSTARNV